MVFSGYEGVEEVASLFKAHGLWGGDVGLDFMGVAAGGVAELERSEAAAVDGDVNRNRWALQGLAHHENCLAVGVADSAHEGDAGADDDIAGDFLPDKMKVVDAEPHVFSAAGYGVGTGGGRVEHRTRMEDDSNILMAVKDAAELGLRGEYESHEGKDGEESGANAGHGTSVWQRSVVIGRANHSW